MPTVDGSDKYGPGGSRSGWFRIANAHWIDWSKAYGDTCPEFQAAVSSINSSRSTDGIRRGLPALTIGDPLPPEWYSTKGRQMWMEFLTLRNRGWKAQCAEQGIEEPDASPPPGSEREAHLLAGGDRVDPEVDRLEKLAEVVAGFDGEEASPSDVRSATDPLHETFWPWWL